MFFEWSVNYMLLLLFFKSSLVILFVSDNNLNWIGDMIGELIYLNYLSVILMIFSLMILYVGKVIYVEGYG